MRFLGKSTASIFLFKGVRPQRLLMSQQIAATLSCYIQELEERRIELESTTSKT